MLINVTGSSLSIAGGRSVATWATYSTVSDEGMDELSLLVIIVDTNPIWWGKRAQGEAEFTLSKCLDAAMVLGNSHLFMSRNNRLAVIASHTQERCCPPGSEPRPAAPSPPRAAEHRRNRA
uniref:General transcription factor IIH subunit 3 n=1 Tax=Nothoprocta perdicaria TaxID=30464 RepID=A0A8C6ZRI9_NOTPE